GLDLLTGETRWKIERKTEGEEEKHLTAYNTPTTMTIDGLEMVVVLQTNDGWKALDPTTGELLWSHAGEYTMRSVGSIASGNGLLFATFGSGGNGKQATALRPSREGPPEVVYELGIADGLGYVPTPVIHDGLLYLWGDGGVLTCRDAETGAEIYRERIGGNFFSSPVIVDDKIVCGSRDGEFVTVELGPKFEILGRSRLSSGMNATPAIANNRLYLRTDTHLLCIEGQ
ncbi:MAG: PQQ-binding-like beta-propeller repeat protein, partial [Verrucomicrobiota bacterium]